MLIITRAPGIQLGMFDKDGKLEHYQHYGIPPKHEVKFRADGYPTDLHSWKYYGGTKVVTAVMHGMLDKSESKLSTHPTHKHIRHTVGKGHAHLVDGSYLCMYDGEGVLSFEKDATQVGSDASRREYTVKIKARFNV